MDLATTGLDEKPPLGADGPASATDDSKPTSAPAAAKPKQKSRRKTAAEVEEDSAKRRCVSTACVACRKRKSKCDGNTPACAACNQVYNTECIYDPNSDHRRKGVYKNDFEALKTRDSTLQTLIQAILNYPEDDIPALIRDIRTCESLDTVAEKIVAKEQGIGAEDDDDDISLLEDAPDAPQTFESQLYGKMGDLRLSDGSVRYIGGTSVLMHMAQEEAGLEVDEYSQQESPITSWTNVTDDTELVVHLLNMYFTWHYTYFTTLSKTLFYRDFLLGKPPPNTKRKTQYCTPLLVNAVLALGCHFTAHGGARENPSDSATAGDHFFREAKRLIMENDEHEKPRLATVQALALMSVREAGCGREAKGWVYSGMSFRMAMDMGLNLDSGKITKDKHVNGDEAEEDVRRVTFWGCFLFDKCWSNYLGRLPQLPASLITVPKIEVFPDEDSAQWSPYSDSGFTHAHDQPARTRAVALQITKLCEISSDLMKHFYDPADMEKTKGKAAELKKLSDIQTRLEAWRRDLPKELEPKEGGLSSVLVMHMFCQLLYIHLFRPFLKYNQATSPLPKTVSPRKLCTQAAGMISKLMRLYKRSHGLRQICNIVIYIAHSACTIHLLNLPEKNAKRDIVHGVKHLEEIAESWLGARRTLCLLSILSRKWKVELPDEAAAVLARTDAKFSSYMGEIQSPSPARPQSGTMSPSHFAAQPNWNNATPITSTPGYFATNPTSESPIVRTISGNSNVMPHQDMQQHYSSTAGTPQSMHQVRNHINMQHMGGDRSATSPSDMFGGVDQLMRESENWVYKDQQRLAVGFDNWNSPREHEPTSWPPNGMNGVVGPGAHMNNSNNGGMPMPTSAGNGMANNGPIANGMHAGVPQQQQQQPFTSSSSPTNPHGAPHDYAITNWMTGGMENMPRYDESNWYE